MDRKDPTMNVIATATTCANLFDMHVTLQVNSGNGWAMPVIKYTFTTWRGDEEHVHKGMKELDMVYTDNTMDHQTFKALQGIMRAEAAKDFKSDGLRLQVLGNCLLDILPLISNQLVDMM